ncbi:M28 family metallopeptidase [Streptomyces sp. 184]|uniref:M28 family metallopeptidase n=1 Tax=Streptomyces sp. 184 TaxID=1827526 RepID=UPI00389262B0
MRKSVPRHLASPLTARPLLTLLLLLLLTTSVASVPRSATSVDAIAGSVRGKQLDRHLTALKNIADMHGGTRSRGTPGYDASVAYVAGQLRGFGYDVSYTDVEFGKSWTEPSPPGMAQVSPRQRTYSTPDDFATVVSSGAGDVAARIRPVDVMLPMPPAENASTSGCEMSDFKDFAPGDIALLQRGTCSHYLKARNAEAAGAGGIVFFNDGYPGRTDPFVFDIADWRWALPIVYATAAVGQDLAAAPDTTVRLEVDARAETGLIRNVLAESPRGSADDVVLAGGHLDSAPEGPGMNDNASGVAALLETARVLADQPLRNRVRFAFWGGEAAGLLGSTQYVGALPAAERERIGLYLNFDMLASPNYAYKILDGDDSDGVGAPAGPPGSAAIERVFASYYERRGLGHVGIDFAGTSDYSPFTAHGIPVGGLVTGARGLKTETEAALFGGRAGEAYDPCHHRACDTGANVDGTALRTNAGAVATAVATYAFGAPVQG